MGAGGGLYSNKTLIVGRWRGQANYKWWERIAVAEDDVKILYRIFFSIESRNGNFSPSAFAARGVSERLLDCPF